MKGGIPFVIPFGEAIGGGPPFCGGGIGKGGIPFGIAFGEAIG